MNKYPIEVGSIVISKAGRDEGRSFVVIQEVDSDFVLVADGGLRKLDHLKMKRRKHLATTGKCVEGLSARMAGGKPVENHEVRSWLKKEEG